MKYRMEYQYMVIRSIGSKHMGFPVRFSYVVPNGYQRIYLAYTREELQEYAKDYRAS